MESFKDQLWNTSGRGSYDYKKSGKINWKFVGFCKGHGYISLNPCTGIKPIKDCRVPEGCFGWKK